MLRRSVAQVVILTGFFVSFYSFGHGENVRGPHGGFVRMPGSFHTELTQSGEDKLRVYLLDINWKNPITKDSKVSAQLTSKTAIQSIKCDPKKNYFECKLPKGFEAKNLKEVSFDAERGENRGGPAVYLFPLKLSK